MQGGVKQRRVRTERKGGTEIEKKTRDRQTQPEAGTLGGGTGARRRVIGDIWSWLLENKLENRGRCSGTNITGCPGLQ